MKRSSNLISNARIVVLDNPNSLFNQLKQTLALIAGIVMLIVSMATYLQMKEYNYRDWYFVVAPLFFSGGLFVYYAFFRPAFHKKCYMAFTDHSIKARLAAPYNPKSRFSMIFDLMFSPEYREFQVNRDEIKEIQIHQLEIEITLNNGETLKVDLDGYDYQKVVQIKSAFERFKTMLNAG